MSICSAFRPAGCSPTKVVLGQIRLMPQDVFHPQKADARMNRLRFQNGR